jgi:hypothetical protein
MLEPGQVKTMIKALARQVANEKLSNGGLRSGWGDFSAVSG